MIAHARKVIASVAQLAPQEESVPALHAIAAASARAPAKPN